MDSGCESRTIDDMKTLRLLTSLFLLSLAGQTTVRAYEVRTWTSADGRTIQAELLSFDGTNVTVKDTAGQRFTFAKTKLGQADIAYLNEYAKVAPSPFGDKSANEKVANPAKEAKIDPKTFKEAGDFDIPGAKFQVLETTHFKIMHSKGAKPDDLAELAERMWCDAAFFHSGFARQFQDRRMAIFLVDDEYVYKSIGEWYCGLLKAAGGAGVDAAEQTAKTWMRAQAGAVQLPASIADPNGVLTFARVFRNYEIKQAASAENDKVKTEKIKGVWIPFRVHCLAGDLLSLQTEGTSGFGSRGLYALHTGLAYYKEIYLTGRSETSILSSESVQDVKTTGGFSQSDKWGDELRKMIRKGEFKPSFDALLNMTAQGAKPENNVLAYTFLHFLHSSQARVAGWSALVERISTSNQVPDAEEMAKLLGFPDKATLEKEWLDYVNTSKIK